MANPKKSIRQRQAAQKKGMKNKLPTFDPNYGDWMRDQRGDEDQKDLAQRLHVSAALLSQWELGLKTPKRDQVTNWATTLRPGDQRFIWEALNKVGYSSKEFDELISYGDFYAHRLTQLFKESRNPRLNFESIIKQELERFSEVWRECFEIRGTLFENKNYPEALNRSEEMLYDKNRRIRNLEPRALAYLLDIAGNSNYHQGEFGRALNQLSRAHELGNSIKEDLDDSMEHDGLATTWRQWLALTNDHYSDVLRVVGEYDDAMERCEEAELLFVEADDMPGKARAIRKKALVNLVRGAAAIEAIAYCNESIALLKKIDHGKHHLYEIAKTLATRGWANNISGEQSAAVRDHSEALQIWKETGEQEKGGGQKYEIMKCYRYLGDDFEQSGEFKKAEAAYLAALDSAKEHFESLSLTSDHEVGMIYLGLGRVYTQLGRGDIRALGRLEKALAIFRSSHHESTDKVREGLVLRNLAKFYINREEKAKALRFSKQAVESFSIVDADSYSVGTHLEMANFAARIGDENLFAISLREAKKLLDGNQPPFDDFYVKNKYNALYKKAELNLSVFKTKGRKRRN